jgi:hypothetical protein
MANQIELFKEVIMVYKESTHYDGALEVSLWSSSISAIVVRLKR